MQDYTITEDTLTKVGIELKDKDIPLLLDHLNETLEERIGAEITESLADDKLKELLDLQESGNDEATANWLSTNVPELEQIIQDETDILLGELAENSDGVNQTA